MSEKQPDSYIQIFRSTSIIGGAAGISLLLGMVQTKFAAMFIGPVGVGLVGAYKAIQGVFGTVAGMGVQQSAVRDIAAAVGRNEDEAIGRIILSLRRVSWLTGLIGAILMTILAVPLSQYTFASRDYAPDIALLGPAILFANIQGGQSALLQGMRRIGDLARIEIIASLAGTFVAVTLYALLGMRGIVPSLLLMAFIQLITTWAFSRKVKVPVVSMSWKESFLAVNGMFRLGLVLMWNGLMAAILVYLTRAWISQDFDLLSVGIFTAAFSLSGMFINFILGAMGANYYPRLTEVSHDHLAMNRLINEQTEIGLLLAVPGLLATLTLAPWIIRIFYTGEFLPAAALLQWFILGCLGRVISWPLGFVMLALAKSKWFFLTETTFNLLHLVMVWVGLATVGVEGVAVAFFCLYFLYVVVVYGVARNLIGFIYSPSMNRLLIVLVPMLILAFLSGRYLSLNSATFAGVILTTITSILCFMGLLKRLDCAITIGRIGLKGASQRWIRKIQWL